MFIPMDDDLRAQLTQRAERLTELLPPAKADRIRSMTDEMNRDGGMSDARLTAFRQLLTGYSQPDDDDDSDAGASPEEENRMAEEQLLSGANELARLLMVRMQTLLQRAEMAARRRNLDVVLIRKRGRT